MTLSANDGCMTQLVSVLDLNLQQLIHRGQESPKLE